jgi:CRISPR/Cas system-associated exonuclease Cas4 (RecB family)
MYRMSSLGHCPRALSAARLAYEPLPEPRFLQVAGREGERHEGWVIEDLEAEGWEVTDRQREVRLRYPAFELVGHIDGIARRNGDRYLLEVKSMSRFRYQSFVSGGFTRFRDYAYQITAYQKAVNLPVMYVVKNRDSGQVLEPVPVLEKPPADWEQVYDTILSVELAARKKQLCPATYSDDFACRTCRYRYLCQGEQGGPAPVEAEVVRAAGLRRRAMELEAEAKELITETTPVLLAAARESGKLTVDDLAITYVAPGDNITYPVTKLREYVTADVLEKVKTVKKRSEYIRVDDLRV